VFLQRFVLPFYFQQGDGKSSTAPVKELTLYTRINFVRVSKGKPECLSKLIN